MQSRAKGNGQGIDEMACEAGTGTDPFAAVPNRRDRASGQTKAQPQQLMTQIEEPHVFRARPVVADNEIDGTIDCNAVLSHRLQMGQFS